MAERQEKTVVLSEDLSSEIERLLEYGRERGRVARETRLVDSRTQPVHTIHPDKPDITELLREELISALEDEVVPAVRTGPARGILEGELQREIAKKALVGLKLHMLRQIAEKLRLDKRGNLEDVADRIARTYRYDEHEIAQLVLDHDEDPEPDRGHSDRIFPLQDAPDLDHVVKRLGYVTGRYIRVGVARWFVFEEVKAAEGRVILDGILRAYNVSVNVDDDLSVTADADGSAAGLPASLDPEPSARSEATLGSSPTELPVRVSLLRGSKTLRIRSKNVSAARAAVRALAIATDAETLGHLPLATRAYEGPLGSFAEHTTFMLDLVDNRLADAHASNPNLTVARFAIERSDETHEEEGERPRVREVRFEGDHLLDSLAACRLIALDGRVLADLSLRVSFGDSDEVARFPLRISLERDHVLLITGFGRGLLEQSAALHRLLVNAVEQALDSGVKNVERLEALAVRIDAFARANQEVDRPTMLKEDDESAPAGGS